MADPPELWAFVLSNIVTLALGGVLMALSYRAYRRTKNHALKVAVSGFGLITLGSLVEMIYELGIRGSYELTGRELLLLHTVEGLLIAAGLAVLFYSISRY